jgi:hypothetical protein
MLWKISSVFAGDLFEKSDLDDTRTRGMVRRGAENGPRVDAMFMIKPSGLWAGDVAAKVSPRDARRADPRRGR